MFTFEDIFKDKEKVIFVTAHPDDVDIFFGGTLARLRKDKKQVKVVVVTNGARGSKDRDVEESDLAKERFEEEKTALSILGLGKENLATLHYLDGEVESNLKLIGEIAGEIKKFKPQIVLTHDPQFYYQVSSRDFGSYINHRDHRNTGISVLDAVYPFSRDRSFFKDHLTAGLLPHTVYEIVLTGESNCNAKFKITEFIEQKRKALLAHKSQFSAKIVKEIIEEFHEDNNYFETATYLKLAW